MSIARNLILEITRHYHTPVTHPGIVHKEIDIDSKYFNFVIGAKGSEIKHIQANYKVSVHIPSEDTHHQHILVVGEPPNVDAAEKHILKLVEKVSDDLIKNKRKIFLLTGYFLGWDRRMRRRRRRDWLFCRAATAADAAGSRSLRRPSLLLLRPAPQPPPPLATGDIKNRPTGSPLLIEVIGIR